MLDVIPGLRIGHHTDLEARTGATVVLADRPVTASGEVRGSAPATREFALLDPLATVSQIDAVVLSGGSAFGLAAGDGVMAWLDEHGRGFETAWGRVPIVVGMSLFDLPVGDPTIRPMAEDGYAAAAEAHRSAAPRVSEPPVRQGAVRLGLLGAGTGATVSKWRGAGSMVDSGLVGAVRRDGDVVVAALVAVNAWGDVVGTPEADLPGPDISQSGGGEPSDAAGAMRGNTTIGVVATNAAADKLVCAHMARGAHDGLARAVSPPHRAVDGDAFVALATGECEAPQDLLRWMAVQATDDAIRAVGAIAGHR